VWEADSEQVPQGKDEKHSAKRVKPELEVVEKEAIA